MKALLEALQREARWENTSGAVAAAEALGALPGDEPVRALLEVLRRADETDLSEDAGDGSDEVWRLRAAAQAGLVVAGARAVPLLLAQLRGAARREGRHLVALRVLARAGVADVAPLATAWALDDAQEHEAARWAAIEALGLLAPPDAGRTLREVLARPGAINSGWTKRLTAAALARLGDVEALEVLLDDADWFARLGVAEALPSLDRQASALLRRRVAEDVDERVRAAGRLPSQE